MTAKARLHPDVLTAGRIDPQAWQAAVDAGGHVGVCGCGLPLKPRPADEARRVTFYPAVCSAGHEASTPLARKGGME